MSFFAIGIERGKCGHNLGSLWRSAELYGAAFVFTIGARYKPAKDAGAADTMKAVRRVPLLHVDSPGELPIPYGAPLVGVELDPAAIMIHEFRHPTLGVYVLGAEDHGLTRAMRERCHFMVCLPGARSMNVACAGTVVMHERWRATWRAAQ